MPYSKWFKLENTLIDNIMSNITGNELKCLLLIIRKTRGWHKISDKISISQFMKATGLSNRVVIKCCRSLASKGLIKRQSCPKISIYNFENINSLIITKNHKKYKKKSQKEGKKKSYTKNIFIKTKNKENKKNLLFIKNNIIFRNEILNKIQQFKITHNFKTIRI